MLHGTSKLSKLSNALPPPILNDSCRDDGMMALLSG
jgi:hypothetical protein